MKHKLEPAYIAAWRKRIAAENVRAAYLMALQRAITERMEKLKSERQAA